MYFPIIDVLKENFIAKIPSIVTQWLDDHPEATTTVQDGALTEPKFAESLKLKTIKDYVTPEMFEAKGDGVTDDTDSILSAIATGKTVVFINSYFCASPLTVANGSVLEFLNGAELLFNGTNGIVTNAEARSIKLIRPRIRNISETRAGIGIYLIQARNCQVISPYINMFDEGINLDGKDTWCATNYIENPFIYRFNTGIHLTANSGKQVNDTVIVGGYVIDDSTRTDTTYGLRLDCQGDTNFCFGLAVEDLEYGYWNNSSASAKRNLVLIGCRAENCRTNGLYNSGEGVVTYGCVIPNIRGGSAWNNNIDGQNLGDSFFNKSMKMLDHGNTLRTPMDYSSARGLRVKAEGNNVPLNLAAYNSGGGLENMITLGGGGVGDVKLNTKSFYMKTTGGMWAKISVSDSGVISATVVT